MTGKSKIESIDHGGRGDDRGVIIIGGSIDLVIARKGVSGSKLSTGEDCPNDVTVL